MLSPAALFYLSLTVHGASIMYGLIVLPPHRSALKKLSSYRTIFGFTIGESLVDPEGDSSVQRYFEDPTVIFFLAGH